MYASGQTDIHTDTLITVLRILTAGEVIAYNQSICLAVFSGPECPSLSFVKTFIHQKTLLDLIEMEIQENRYANTSEIE